MLHAVKKVEYIKDYKLKLTFRNKDVKIVDLKDELWGLMFEPLVNIEYFQQVKIDGSTIAWPNGADFCPDVLYEIGKEVKENKRGPIKRTRHSTSALRSSKGNIAAKSKS
ncbi:MAG: DUF2442 domain-containing protein [Parachlamydiales bacterium]|jgi:hypothetical protein